ncbi:MAG: FAD:protein FMN transferase [Eubacteriales bacterium]|nr:FAD:protein FMN transferase [Eubacteriales bacterium]
MKHTKTFSKAICLILCIASLLTLSACGEAKPSQIQVSAMDTVMTVTAYGKNADKGLTAAESIIKSLDVMLDPGIQTSTVYAINTAQGSSTVVSGQVADMLSKAYDIYQKTKSFNSSATGMLDLTLYPLVKKWGFMDNKFYVPNDAEIQEQLARRCFDSLVLSSFPNSASYSVTIPSYGELSFACCARGAASENAVEAMRQAGVTSGIISLSGNVQTLGLKPDGTNWNVAIQDPDNTSTFLGVISVGETAVVTSGRYQRSFTDGKGNTYHHLLSPTTGYPANNSLKSCTIICDDGTLADCLSTAMFVIGESNALNYWRQYGGFEMILVTNDNEVICTKGLMERFTLSNAMYTLKYKE